MFDPWKKIAAAAMAEAKSAVMMALSVTMSVSNPLEFLTVIIGEGLGEVTGF